MDLTYRKAEKNDLPRIIEIIHDAQAVLKADGIDQWQDGSPNPEVIQQDMEFRSAFVIIADNAVEGFFVVSFEPEEDYKNPAKGKFKFNLPYATIHRTAISKNCKGKGISHFMFESAFAEIKEAGLNFARIDTHLENKRMRHIMMREGFEESAVIVLSSSGQERIAAEKQL
ncbi:MAG: hypothetical protein UHY90_05870 [Treponema sp.]|nr:hypothetical protein [Treponema sp.]